MGSTPHAHARAKVENPHKQGLAAMISVFIDTFIILNLTVFSILTTGVLDSGKEGTALTQAAFTKGFGNFGDIFVAVCLLFSHSPRFLDGIFWRGQCQVSVWREGSKILFDSCNRVRNRRFYFKGTACMVSFRLL